MCLGFNNTYQSGGSNTLRGGLIGIVVGIGAGSPPLRVTVHVANAGGTLFQRADVVTATLVLQKKYCSKNMAKTILPNFVFPRFVIFATKF